MDRKELRKQVTRTATIESEDEIRQAWKKFAAIVLVVFGICLLVLTIVLMQRGTAVKDEGPIELAEKPLSLSEFSILALETARGFSNATSVTERASYVMEPRRVMPLMETYHERVPLVAREVRELTNERFHVAEKREFLLVTVVFEGNVRESWVFEKNDEGKVKLQWEVAVGYSDKDWDAFVTSRDTTPGTFRILSEYMVTNPYYNFDFTDPEAHSCFILRHPRSDLFVYGYLDTASEAHKKFVAVRLISDLVALPIIAKVRFLEGGQPDQVVIDDIETFSWISGVDM